MFGSSAAFVSKRSIPENVYTLAARIEDADHGADWLDSCAQSFTVRDADNPEGLPNRVEFEAYERLKGLPIAGIADRDVFLHGAWQRDGNALVCRLSPSQKPVPPPPAGVVRMPNVQGRFHLAPGGANATCVTYALDVDLGGDIPKWIRDMAVEQIPRKSLDKLAQQAQKGAGIYEQRGHELSLALDAVKG